MTVYAALETPVVQHGRAESDVIAGLVTGYEPLCDGAVCTGATVYAGYRVTERWTVRVVVLPGYVVGLQVRMRIP